MCRRTWPTSHKRTKLPNNNSGIQALMLSSGKTVLVFNNLQGLQRFPLSIAISEDAGETWPYVRDLGAHPFYSQKPSGSPSTRTRAAGAPKRGLPCSRLFEAADIRHLAPSLA